MAKKTVAGEGTRYKTLKTKLKKSGRSEQSAAAIAASIGRKKFGATDMAKAAAAGRVGTVHKMKEGGN